MTPSNSSLGASRFGHHALTPPTRTLPPIHPIQPPPPQVVLCLGGTLTVADGAVTIRVPEIHRRFRSSLTHFVTQHPVCPDPRLRRGPALGPFSH